MSILNKLKTVFDSNERQIRGTDEELEKIKTLEPKVREMSYEEIRSRVDEMRKEIKPLVEKIPEEDFTSLKKIERQDGLPTYEMEIKEKLLEFMPEVFAFMNEVYRRKTGYAYHDVQLRAGIILAQGQRLVEQYTGEGKTRTFQLPLALYSIVGRGAHLVTPNDYLTKVGGEYAGHILSELGISVGLITPQTSYKFIPDDKIEAYKGEEVAQQREGQKLQIDAMDGLNLLDTPKREAYLCDVTYGTNNEFGFDYLRDNMAWEMNKLAQRELYFCIVDEADSILIDEARTPLIISATPEETDTEKYVQFAQAVENLEEEKDYEVDHKQRSVTLTEEGIEKVEKNMKVDNLWEDFSMAYHVENALKAKVLFNKDEQYIIRGGEVMIVDEFTGRMMKGRRYSEGLHQAIEAKEGVEIKQETKTYATITFQNYFRLYKFLCGGSGTVMTEAEEFYKIYGLESVSIPTNRPNIRKDLADRIYKNQQAKFNAVVRDVKEKHEKGRPVLIGTTSVDKSEYLSNLLDKEGIPHEVLNAKYHEQESRIVAQAGKKGAVTVATNMAGRGTDIVIGGGSRGDESWQEIVDLGGLHVIGTERHEARRIDNQLRGRTGRQGEPGSTRFYVALDDQIMRVLGGDMISGLLNMVNAPDDVPIEMGLITRQIETAQKRIEGMNFDSRKRVVEYDDVMNQHREIFYSRRRKLLKTAEYALGRFEEGSRVIDLNLPEHKDKVENYEDRIEKSKKELEDMIEESVLLQAENIVDNFLQKNGKVDEKNIDELIESYIEFVPDYLLLKVTGKEIDGLKKYLREELLSGDKKNSEKVSREIRKLTKEVFSEKLKEFGENFYYLAKMTTFQNMDKKWVDHLEIMTDIRHGISLQSYAQKDPLVEYKNQAFGVFNSLMKNIDKDVSDQILKLRKAEKGQVQISQRVVEPDESKLITNTNEIDDVSTGDREYLTGTGEDSSQNADNLLKKIEKSQSKVQAGLKTNTSASSAKTVVKDRDIGRNEKVKVRYKDGKIVEKKYKRVQRDIENGKAELVE